MARRRHIFAPCEGLIQAAVVDHWKLLGEPNTLVAAIPNANAHGQPGLTRGLPDLLVMGPDFPGMFPVAFMELKRDEHSVVSDDQLEFQRLCGRLGVRYAIVYGRDEPIAMLEAWGVVRRAAA